MTQLRFTQLYDYVIGTLYQLKLMNETGFFSLKKILKEVLEYPATADDTFQIGKYLEAKGFVKCLFTLGDVQVEITPSGIVHWENNLSGISAAFESKIGKEKIQKLSKRPNLETETLDARKEIFEKLSVVLGFTNKIKDQNPDLAIDAKILDLEFRKIKPDREVILSKLLSIDQLPTVRGEVRYLKEALSL